MSWRPIAHKDVQDAGRSWTIWAMFAALLVLFLGFFVIDSLGNDGDVQAFVDGLVGIVGLVLPVLALLLGYKSIAHERIDGSIVLLLSFPHSRRDLVLGKYLGRSIVLLVPTLVALLLAFGAATLRYGGLRDLVWVPWILLVTGLYGLAFLAIAVGISMSSTADRRVTLGAFGAYLLLVTFWDTLVTTAVVVLYRFDFDILVSPPSWSYLADLLTPSEAFYRLIHIGFEMDRSAQYIGGDAPWFVDWWMAVLILLAWIVVPLWLGFYRFERQDL